MDKFIVSARKYRPKTFNTVIGQPHITTTLKNAIKNNQLAHAFLFCGPRGVGKTTCARILAKTINCDNPTSEGEACNECNSCISFNEGISMNYFELDAASNNSVDDIRELVNQIRFLPQTGRYKVYVIDEVHMLSSSAFNAFLKTLEEPPSHAIFILATTEKHKILPTILSRCQIFDFKRIRITDTVAHLQEICKKEEIKADPAALQLIAQKSEGCMRDALSILDKIASFTGGALDYTNTLEHLNILDAEYYFKILDCMMQQDLAGALLLYDDINSKGFEGDLVLEGFSEFIRNLLVCKDERVANLLEAVDSFKEKYMEAAKKASSPLLIGALNILNETQVNYKAARNKRLHAELALIKLCYLQQAMELTVDQNGLSKKKIVETVRAVPYRQIAPFELKKQNNIAGTKPQAEAKLIIEIKETIQVAEAYPKYKKPAEDIQQQLAPSTSPVKTGSGKLTALGAIREQYRNNGTAANGQTNNPIAQEHLKECWNSYIQNLKEENNPAVQSFEMASLRITDNNSFEIITTNNLQQKFIENERNKLFDHLHKLLKNRQLQFTVLIEEVIEDKADIQAPLSSKEQYQKMTENYPLVKELKDRLKLELDY